MTHTHDVINSLFTSLINATKVENSGSESENEPAMTVPRGKEEATAARCRLCGKKSRKTVNIFAPGGLSGLIEDCLRLKVRRNFSFSIHLYAFL